MPTEFRLPELGENITTGDVLRVLVAPGDNIQRDQPIVELETDKATIEVPSSVSGRVTDLKVKAGDKVSVGQLILVVDGDSSKSETAGSSVRGAEPAQDKNPSETTADPPVAAPRAAGEPVSSAQESESRGRRGEVVEMPRIARPAQEPPDRTITPAAPSVRRLARELGVDISEVAGSGPGGRITIDDVKGHARLMIGGHASARAAATSAVRLPDFSKWGAVERKPMSSIRRKTAHHLGQAWATIPHVTQHDRADVTNLEELRKRLSKKAEEVGGSMTVTAIALKVVAAALKLFPQFNASVDMEREEVVLKKYVHIGVAVDTDRGLLVPVIRDVDTKSLIDVAVELTQMAERARTHKLSLPEMEGGTFTVTNLGGIGGTSFSPIINAPEVAILGVSRASVQPLFLNGQFQARLTLPLSLSYDHRVIDGADGIRFLRWIVEAFEQPLFLLA